MTEGYEPDIEDSELDNQDHENFFLVSPLEYWWYVLLILTMAGGMFYWYSSTMKENSNKKTQQVRQILKTAKDLPDEPTPLTLEIEEMARNTDRDRNYIIGQLAADSFPEKFNKKLKNRFQRQTTYLELPNNWRDRLPPKVEKWAKQEQKQRVRNIKVFLKQLDSTMQRIEDRIDRVDEIIDERGIEQGTLGGAIKRYESIKKTVRKHFKDIRTTLDRTSIDRPDIPEPLFNEIRHLIDPLTTLSMHFRDISAFSSAPSAYYHSYRLLHDALRIDPKNPEAHYLLGKVYRRINLHNLAGEQMARALKYNSNYKREEILTELRNRLQEKPDNPRRNYDLAYALYEAGNKTESKKYLKKTLRLLEGKHTMVKVLARKRLSYILDGEPQYSKLPLF